MRTFLNTSGMRWVAMVLVVSVGLISLVPRVEAGFIPSEESFSNILRQKDMATVQKALQHKLIKQRLKALGYTEEEIKDRLDQLSDTELHNLASQMDTLTVAGDGLGVIIAILVIVLLVVLIIKLMDKTIVIS